MFSFGSSTPVVVVEEKKEKEEDEKSTKAEEEVETDDWEDLDDIENPVDLEDEIAAITVKRPANATEEDEKDEKEETEPEALLLYNGHRVSQQQIEQRAKHERLRKVNCHFYDILAKGTHSDITFLVGAKKEPIKAHRLMLAARSSVFAAMLFSKHFYESSHANVLEIEIPDVDPEAFRVMLRAMYTDVVELKPDQAMNVLFCAKKYQVEVLRFACIAYMKKDLTAENALSLFENLPGLLEEEQFVMQFVVEHLDELLESKDFVDLSKAKVLELVKSDQSACTEAKLFAAVVRWSTAECQRKGLEDTRDNRRKVLEEILPFIRFPIMSLSELSSAVAPTGILDDNAMIQLFTYLASNGAMPLDLPFNTKERELSKFNFACKADASNQYLYPGILQYIGTKEKRQDWQNPHTQGLVEVTASSHSPSLNPNNQLFHCVEINPSTSYGTENQANSWVMVDFKNYAVVPTHYRFSNTRKSNCMPTHLILQGSNDKEKWDELDVRQRAAGLMESYYGDDSDLVGFSGTPTGTPQNVTSAVWKVNKPTKTPYRYLRFFQPNMSSNGGFGHLCCAGIEFYGALVKKSVRTK